MNDTQETEASAHKHFRFFQNTKCEYFPCHKIKHKERFNCLFCFCPLYLVPDCGGKYEYFIGIKDCTKCNIPHIDTNYDRIINKLKQSLFNAEK